MKKNIFFLLICLTGIIYSCKEDEGLVKADSHEKSHHGFKRNIISFEEMKSRLNINNGALRVFQKLANKGGNDYIQNIDIPTLFNIQTIL